MSFLYLRNQEPGVARYSAGAGLYDFAMDGGAQGSIDMGVFIPEFAVITRFNVTTLTAPVGAGASISFGISGSVQLLMVTTGIAAFVINQTLQGVDFNANPQMTGATANVPILMTISGAALTAGKLKFDIEYAEYDF